MLQDILETVFDNGELVKEYTFAEVRENAELTIVKDAKKATKVKRCSLSLHLFTLSSLFVTLTRTHARSHVHIRTHTTKFLCLAVFEVSSLLLFRNKKISSPKLQLATGTSATKQLRSYWAIPEDERRAAVSCERFHTTVTTKRVRNASQQNCN